MLDEAAAEQQIPRQIANQRELRRHGQIGSARPSLADGTGDQPGVAGQIPDRRVDLQQRDFHVLRYSPAPLAEAITRGASQGVASRTRRLLASTVVRSLNTGMTTDRSGSAGTAPSERSGCMETQNVPHLLIFAPNWLGDAVMSLPAIADLR